MVQRTKSRRLVHCQPALLDLTFYVLIGSPRLCAGGFAYWIRCELVPMLNSFKQVADPVLFRQPANTDIKQRSRERGH